MALALENVTNSFSLTNYVTNTVTVDVTDNPAANQYLCVNSDGAFPAADGEYALGPISYLGEDAGTEQYATVATAGQEICRVEPAETILLDGNVSVTTAGTVRAAAAGDAILGKAMNASAGSTIASPHFIVVNLDAQAAVQA